MSILTDEEIQQLGRPQLHLMPLMKAIAQAQLAKRNREIEERLEKAVIKIKKRAREIISDELVATELMFKDEANYYADIMSQSITIFIIPLIKEALG